jgi:8-oxo-dGTP diphosphatase
MSNLRPPRIAVRAIILHDDKLLLVNAWKGRTHLWCAPGGGAVANASLPDNLIREVHEETGLTVTVGKPCLINEFHDPLGDFHQVDIYFRCQIGNAVIDTDWVSRAEIAQMQVKPDSLAAVAWADADAISYDPLEPIVK